MTSLTTMTSPSATRVGAFTITTLWDGDFPCGPDLVAGAASPQGETLFGAAGLPAAGPSPEPINAFAVDRGDAFWLIDAGCGTETPVGFGRVANALRALDRPPESVERIVLTHLHGDHIGGLVERGDKVYPNARLVVPEAEWRFWTDPAAPASSREPGENFERARALLSLYAGSIDPIAGAESIAPGLSFVPLPGHTPGHSGVMIEDNGERLLMWADTTHSNLLQLAHPEWSVAFDNDPDQAVATRQALLTDLARSGLLVAGSHAAGRGRIVRNGQGFALVPDGANAKVASM